MGLRLCEDRGRAGRRKDMWIGGAVGVMVDGNIDWTDDGEYKSGSVMPYASRKQAAQSETFNVVRLTGSVWEVQRAGHATHEVTGCIWGDGLYFYCDCHDFLEYGAGFARACMHIWKVYLTQDIGVC